MTQRVERLEERHDRAVRLGRHVNHDERSKDYPAATAPLQTVQHGHHGRILNQGQTSSCTGQAVTDALNGDPLWMRGKTRSEKLARQVYSLATQIDPYPGQWPPTDTGSDGLSVCKAAKQLGWISNYTHAFGIDQALGALVRQPVLIGVQWMDSMFDPDPSTGLLDISGKVAGGHEIALFGLDVAAQQVKLLNSWGKGWGFGGYAFLRFADLDALLRKQGDCTVPVV